MRSDGGFATREHVFPESLGNSTLVLPRGVVCDRCNNGKLSELDQAICEFLPVKMRRTMLGVRSKTGKVPATRFTTSGLYNDGGDSLRLIVDSPTDTSTFQEVGRRGDEVDLKFRWRGGRRLTPRYGALISRAVLKSAFECAWLDHGERMLEPQFDHVRDGVLGLPRDGFLAVVKHGEPEDVSVTLQYDFRDGAEDGIWVVARYFGVTIATDSKLAQPAATLPTELIELLTFSKSDYRRSA